MNLLGSVDMAIGLVVFLWLSYEFIYRCFGGWREKKEFKRFIEEDIVPGSLQNENPVGYMRKNSVLTRTRVFPIIGWTMLPNIDNGVITVDENGFRNDKNMSLEGKTVVAIFGDSVAMGSMASDTSHTIAARLQRYLQEEYGNDVIVLNLAQSSFTMIQEISLFNLLVDKFNIKVSIFINGYTDVKSMLVQKKTCFDFISPFYRGWEKSTQEDIKVDSFFRTSFRLLCRFSSFCQQIRHIHYLIATNKNKANTQIEMMDYSGMVVRSFKSSIEIVNARLSNSVRYALMSLQPVIYDCKEKSAIEEDFLQRNPAERIKHWQKCYNALREGLYGKSYLYYADAKSEKNTILADFSQLTQQAKEAVFVDDCHLGDAGQDLYARHLFNVIRRQGWLESRTSSV